MFRDVTEPLPRSGRLLLAALLCLLFSLLAACAASEAPPPAPDPSGLVRSPAAEGEYVHVKVRGASKAFNEDCASLVTGMLQSDCGLLPAAKQSEAAILIKVNVQDIALVSTEKGRISGRQALANTAVGTTLGLGLGGLAGRRTGALIGAGLGAALGLGITAADTQDRETWTLKAEVTISRAGHEGTPQAYATVAAGEGMDREAAETALKNRLAEDIVGCLKSTEQN